MNYLGGRKEGRKGVEGEGGEASKVITAHSTPDELVIIFQLHLN